MKLARSHEKNQNEIISQPEPTVIKAKASGNLVLHILGIAFIAAFLFENLDHFLGTKITELPTDKPAQKGTGKQPTQQKSVAAKHIQFYQAVAQNDFDMVRDLLHSLDFGEINSVTGGMTPVMKAASTGNVRIVELLLENGADPNKRGSQSRTALQYAAERNRLAVARLLLKHGADINGTDNSQLSPLTMSADRRYHNFAMFLIDKGADVNIQHVQGWTALIDAARNGDLVLVKRLVKAGADIELRTHKGHSALDVARRNGHKDVEVYLMKQYER